MADVLGGPAAMSVVTTDRGRVWECGDSALVPGAHTDPRRRTATGIGVAVNAVMKNHDSKQRGASSARKQELSDEALSLIVGGGEGTLPFGRHSPLSGSDTAF